MNYLVDLIVHPHLVRTEAVSFEIESNAEFILLYHGLTFLTCRYWILSKPSYSDSMTKFLKRNLEDNGE